MKNRVSVINLVERAQRGETEVLNRLAGAVKMRLYEYTVRMTLDEQLAEDVVQESLITMVQDIGILRDARQFWPWLMKIATNKVRHHHRRDGRRSRLLSECPPSAPGDAQDAVADVISKEIRQIVLSAMHRLPLEHRLVLNMRCYEEMSFTEIAEALDCRKFKARALFAKAKRTLGKNLAQSGLGKASLLGVLVIYGKMTATSEATGMATFVTAASLKVGILPTLAAVTATRAALVTIAAAGVSVGSTAVVVDRLRMSRLPVSGPSPMVAAIGGESLPSPQQYWYYYPPKSEDAVLIQIRTVTEDALPEWSWFQNEQGNYACSGDAVRRIDAHYYAPDLTTMRLPTDDADFRAFLDEAESKTTVLDSVRPAENGLLVVAGLGDEGPFTHARSGYDIADEQAFQHPWQRDARITDCRDALHKEGWAYLCITGQIKGRTVTGIGRIPFVLAERRAMSPWLRIVVEDSIVLEDTSDAAMVCDHGGHIRYRFEGGTFLEGLSRPWEGLHTIDTVRRDAAGRRLWFETQESVEDQCVDITVTDGDLRLVYTIDLDRDEVREIILYERQAEVGRLQLEYVREPEPEFAAIAELKAARGRSTRQKADNTLWLLSLVRAAWE